MKISKITNADLGKRIILTHYSEFSSYPNADLVNLNRKSLLDILQIKKYVKLLTSEFEINYRHFGKYLGCIDAWYDDGNLRVKVSIDGSAEFKFVGSSSDSLFIWDRIHNCWTVNDEM